VSAPPRRTLVLGLGNPILTDDAVGLLAVREAERLYGDTAGAVFREASIAGFDLLELLSGFDSAIIVDAIKTGKAPPGSIHDLDAGDLESSSRLVAAHEICLGTALALGARLGIEMPRDVVIVAVEIVDDLTLGERPTAAVEAAVPAVAARILRELAARYG
jgi:hydrogenase maturation protease